MTATTLPLAGSYNSEDGRTSFSWAMPEYTDLERTACRAGVHVTSRKVVVDGWIGYFSQVRRAYCACGSRCWVWFEGGWADKDVTEPGGHLAWIEGHIRMQQQFDEHRQWERRMSEGHPCWGTPYSCISCGCSKDRPCVSHKGARR